MLSQEQRDALITGAFQGKANAYPRYSHFPVGAALLCSDGRIVTGASIENASWGITVCAERTAFVKAVSDGLRSFAGLAVVANTSHISPCGLCRQVMVEFCKPEMPVLLIPGDYEEQGRNGVRETTVGALCPE